MVVKTAVIVGSHTDVMSTVNDATQQLQKHYINNRFSSSIEEWPPYQPKHYTTLAFIHNKGKHTDAVRFSVTQELAVAGKINPSEFHKHSDFNVSMTKKISDIFLPIVLSDGSFVDLYILIEGAPGIGKTVLAKEIAYQWAKNQLLPSKKLLLLVLLRECHQTRLKSIESLLQFVFRNSKIVSCLRDHLVQTIGSDTVIVFDGFDELSAENKKESIIIDIINRKILTKCCLVVTSRPTASSCLHGNVDRRVEIVGFTEEDRLDYIQTALENCDEKVKGLQDYLQCNPTINALCYIPLNMTILLCLAEDGIDALPKTQTDMYKNFIQMTIIRFIKKYKGCTTVIEIADLPCPYDKVFVELANLAYKALEIDKIVFTIFEIKEGCPNLTMTPSNWNGLGLLKAAPYFSPQMGNDQVTFHFLHFSIQEYMAAWYISTLSDNKQIKLLQKTFWEHRYYNTWIMYVGITGGSSFALRHFLSGNRFQFYSKFFKALRVSKTYLRHKIRCLHLFQCLVEAGRGDDIKSVKQLFQKNQIDLSNQTLLPSDLNTLGFFLIRSINKEWDELDLSNCNIGINGSNILCDILLDKDVRGIVTIKSVKFSQNQLNFSSLERLFGLFTSLHTSEIIITDDAILDDKISIEAIEDIVLQSSTLNLVFIGWYLFSKSIQLSKILSNTTQIRNIYLLNCNWQSCDFETFLELLGEQQLDKVRIIGASLDGTIINAIGSMLVRKNDYVNMLVYDHTMSNEIGDDISSEMLRSSKSISGLMLIITGSKLQGFINTCALSNELSTLELYNLDTYARYSNAKACPWKQNKENCSESIIIETLIEMLLSNINFQLEVAFLEGDTVIVHKSNISNLINSTNSISTTNLRNVATLAKLSISKSNIFDETANDLAAVISDNIYLQHLNLDSNHLKTSGIFKILRSLQEISSLEILCLTHNGITDEAADDIAAVISCNMNLQELDLGNNDLQTSGIIIIARNLQIISSLTKLCINDNNIGKEAADSIASVISCNIMLQKLDIGGNHLQTSGIIKVARSLQKISLLTKLYINNNNITEEAADDIANAIFHNTKLQEIDISSNNIQTGGAIKIAKSVVNISTLTKMHFGRNDITEDAAHDIARAIYCNSKLQEVDVSGNYFQTIGVITIAKALQNICTLKKLNISNTNISARAANNIATAILCNIELEEIDVSENSLEVMGCGTVMKSFLGICMLKKLYIGDNNITREGACDIANAISCNTNLQEIDISRNNLQTTGCRTIMKALQRIHMLRKLNLGYNDITREGASDIADAILCNTNLQEIDISSSILQTTGCRVVMKALQRIHMLRKLNLGYNDITREGASDIADAILCNTNLQEIDISRNYLQTTGCRTIMKALQRIHMLRKLNLGYNNITDAGASDIADAISCNTNLQEIDISRNYLQTTGCRTIMKALQRIHMLRKLNLGYNDITREGASDIADAILCNTNLQEIDISSSILQTTGCRVVMKALQRIHMLRKLNLGYNDITREGASDIADAISCNTNLQEIDISSNNLQTTGCRTIMKALQSIHMIRKLNLGYNNITREGASDIADAILCNTNLQEIDISSNNLQTTGCRTIMKALQSIHMIRKLNLGYNDITREGASDIADAISCNTNLQEIDISRNYLQTTGCRTIMKALQRIHMLRKLNLGYNDITREGASDIADAILCNTNLQEIDISRNYLQTTGCRIVMKALQRIHMLRKLNLGYNNITDAGASDIADAISCNTNLQEIDISIGVAKPGHTRATARASLINAPASASYLIFFKID